MAKKKAAKKTDERGFDEFCICIVPSDGTLEAQIDFSEIPDPYKGRFVELNGEAVYADGSQDFIEEVIEELYYI